MKFFIKVCLVLFLTHLIASAQQYDTSGAISTLPSGGKVMSMRDANNVRMAHYVDVGQYFDYIAVRLIVGEINIRKTNGDTLEIPFESHTSERFTGLLNVYQENSTSIQNPILSRKFILHPGDSLVYFRNAEYSFPRFKPDSTQFIADDTSFVQIPDSVIFSIELIDSNNVNALVQLEEITFKPIENYYRIIYSSSFQPTLPITNSDIERRWIPEDSSLYNRSIRVRVTPIYVPQLYGNFTNRAILAKYGWSVRATALYKTMLGELLSKRKMIEDSVAHNYKSIVNEKINIFPTIISGDNRVISVVGLHSGTVSVHVSIVNILGRVVFDQDYGQLKATNGRLSFILPAFDTFRGYNFLILRVDNEFTVKLIKVE